MHAEFEVAGHRERSQRPNANNPRTNATVWCRASPRSDHHNQRRGRSEHSPLPDCLKEWKRTRLGTRTATIQRSLIQPSPQEKIAALIRSSYLGLCPVSVERGTVRRLREEANLEEAQTNWTSSEMGRLFRRELSSQVNIVPDVFFIDVFHFSSHGL